MVDYVQERVGVYGDSMISFHVVAGFCFYSDANSEYRKVHNAVSAYDYKVFHNAIVHTCSLDMGDPAVELENAVTCE
jgi:hypothetical protein